VSFLRLSSLSPQESRKKEKIISARIDFMFSNLFVKYTDLTK